MSRKKKITHDDIVKLLWEQSTWLPNRRHIEKDDRGIYIKLYKKDMISTVNTLATIILKKYKAKQ